MIVSRFRSEALAAGLLLGLTSCSTGTVTPAPGGSARVGGASIVRSADAASCSTAPCIYVTDGHSKRPSAKVAIFAGDAGGNVPPLAQLRGRNTQLHFPNGITVDDAHNIYVTDRTASVTVYAPGEHGNVAPTRAISGDKTNLFGVAGIGVDRAGRIYVANYPNSYVSTFAAGANGNVSPMSSILGAHTGLATPFGLALDSGGAIYVTNFAGGNGWGSITVYARGSHGDVAPTQTIVGSLTGLADPIGITVDSAQNIYVTNIETTMQRITVYAAGATGNVAPVRTIQGPATKLFSPVGIAVDSTGTMYVTNAGEILSQGLTGNGITVYAPGANGNVAPIRSIAGSRAELNDPEGISVR